MKIWSVWKDRQKIDQHKNVKGSYHWHSCDIYGGEGLLKQLALSGRDKGTSKLEDTDHSGIIFVSDAPSHILYVFVVKIENKIRIVYIAC